MQLSSSSVLIKRDCLWNKNFLFNATQSELKEQNIYFTSGPSYRDTAQNIFQSKTRLPISARHIFIHLHSAYFQTNYSIGTFKYLPHTAQRLRADFLPCGSQFVRIYVSITLKKNKWSVTFLCQVYKCSSGLLWENNIIYKSGIQVILEWL